MFELIGKSEAVTEIQIFSFIRLDFFVQLEIRQVLKWPLMKLYR